MLYSGRRQYLQLYSNECVEWWFRQSTIFIGRYLNVTLKSVNIIVTVHFDSSLWKVYSLFSKADTRASKENRNIKSLQSQIKLGTRRSEKQLYLFIDFDKTKCIRIRSFFGDRWSVRKSLRSYSDRFDRRSRHRTVTTTRTISRCWCSDLDSVPDHNVWRLRPNRTVDHRCQSDWWFEVQEETRLDRTISCVDFATPCIWIASNEAPISSETF